MPPGYKSVEQGLLSPPNYIASEAVITYQRLQFQSDTTVDDNQFQKVKTKLEGVLPTSGQIQQTTYATMQKYQEEMKALLQSYEMERMQSEARGMGLLHSTFLLPLD